MRNKTIFVTVFAIVAVLTSCGARDDKNETENYPTYDTTQKTENVNDSSEGRMQSAGDKRHNIRENEEQNR